MITDARIICRDANPVEYHKDVAERGTPEFVMSNSALGEFYRCPSRWRDGYVSPGSVATKWGSLADCLHLTPHRFAERYAVKPDTYPAPGSHTTAAEGKQVKWNGNAKWCKKWLRFQKELGKETVSGDLVDEVAASKKALFKDSILAEFLDSCDKQVWMTFNLRDNANGLVIPGKCLLDLVPRNGTPFEHALADMKQVRCAGHYAFKSQVFQMGWDIQSALYTDVYRAATQENRTSWCFIIQENFPPYQPGRRFYSTVPMDVGERPKFYDTGKVAYENAFKHYAWCLKNNRWSGYDDGSDAVDGWSLMEPDDRMIQQRFDAKRFEPEPEDSPPTVDDLRAEDEERFDLNV